MKKLKLLFASLALLVGSGTAWAQTDVTSTYITNASFETDGYKAESGNSDYVTGWTFTKDADKTVVGVGPNASGDFGWIKKTVSATDGSYFVGIRHRWESSNARTSTLVQEITIPKGKYTLTADYQFYRKDNNDSRFQMSVEANGGALATVSGTALQKNNTTFDDAIDKNMSLDFEAFTTTNTIKFYVNAKQYTQIAIDNLHLLYNGNYTSELASAIARAQLLYTRTKDADLNTAISQAQGVLEGVDNTIEYQTTIDDEVTTLRTAISTAYTSVTFLTGEDVSFLLENANFESGSAVAGGICTYDYDCTTNNTYASQMLAVEGWTIPANGNGKAAGVLSFGSDAFLGGTSYKPTSVASPTSETKALGVLAVWSATSQYKQDVTLPAGRYVIEVPVYNLVGGTTDFTKNLIGFIENEGTEHLATAKTYTVDSWTTERIEFDLNSDVSGYMSLGYQAANKGSGDMPHLLIDKVKITFTDAANAYAATVASATETYNDVSYVNVVGTERTYLKNLIDADASSYSVAQYFTAIDNINLATSAFTAAKANYDALVAEIAKAKALGIADETADGNAATSTTTAATALTNTQSLMVAEYNYVKDNYSSSVELGSWTTEGPTGSKNDQHWSGEARPYLEQSEAAWGSASWVIKYSQDLTLPSGNYVFKVAGRKAASNKVSLELVVKKGDTEIGTVSDFPEGNTGLGINKAGATSFDPEDAAGFANDNNGRAFQWRYVKFTLTEDAIVKVAVNASASDYNMWVSFCDATVQTDNEANISLIAYNIALNDANNAFKDDTYENVRGDEYNELWSAIAGDNTLDKTKKDKIDEAKALLIEKTSAFTDAKGAYDAFVAAKGAEYAELPYASATKYAAIATAQGAAAATSAADAAEKTAAIQTAVRQYYESNAMAEGVNGAEDKTSLIGDPNFASVTIDGTTAGAWTFDQTGGSANINTNEPFTDGDGNSSYSYFDYYNNGNNNQNIHQIIKNLEPGRYILTATGRGHANFSGNLQLYVVGKGNVKIPAIGNSGGVFGRGWNDATFEFYQTETSDITIGAKTDNSKAQWWGVSRFRLVRLGDAVETVKITSAGYATYCSENALDFSGTGIKVYRATAAAGIVTFHEITSGKVAGSNGLLLKGAEGTYEVPVITDGENEANMLSGVLTATDIDAGNFVLLNGAKGVGFYKTTKTFTVGAHTAYIAASSVPSEGRLFIGFDDEEEVTGIRELNSSANKGAIYNMNGVRVEKAKKGLYIQNGKKFVVK